MISVVVPLYNKENSIVRTVRSILEQSFPAYELIIVDDGSTDNSLNKVQQLDDKRINIITKENGGVSSARNLGIKNANFEYIAFIDGDDIWHKDHLSILWHAIQSNDSADIAGFATSFYKSDTSTFDHEKFTHTEPELINDYYDFVSQPITYFNSSTLLVKKSKISESGYYDENIVYGEDVEFWYRLFKTGSLVYINTVSVLYYIKAENRSTTHIVPLKKRFHRFNFNNASSSERQYFNKLLGLLFLDYGMKFSVSNIWRLLLLYPTQILGGLRYINILRKKQNV